MSRMSEWAWALEEHEPDRDLEMAAFHQYELEEQQRLEQEARRYPVVITPQVFTYEPDSSSAEAIHCIPSMSGVQQTISVEPSGTPHLRKRLPSIWRDD